MTRALSKCSAAAARLRLLPGLVLTPALAEDRAPPVWLADAWRDAGADQVLYTDVWIRHD